MFEELLNEYLDTVKHSHGFLGRPNNTFYAHNIVTESLQWLRNQLLQGRTLNDAGTRFVAGAACYLAYLSYMGFSRRRFEVAQDTQWEQGNPENGIGLVVQRTRNGNTEHYVQDFWLDIYKFVLLPAQPFPVMHGAAIYLKSLTLLSPEYCYMFGTHYMSWPHSGGTWPQGKELGGMKEDFDQARNLLIDDLLTDLNMDPEEKPFRSLSNWIVWPMYGWQSNDFGQYNMMTLLDQIIFKQTVSPEQGVWFLRHLLQSQIFHLRLLAARTLLVLNQTPQTPQETRFYQHALTASDFNDVFPYMVQHHWVIQGNDVKQPVTKEYAENTLKKWQETLHNGPRDEWEKDPVLTDPLYRNTAEMKPDQYQDKKQALLQLQQQYPDNWFVEVADAFLELHGDNPQKAEQRLQQAVQNTPGDPVAHLSLGTWFLEQNRITEAQNLYYDMVKRWPWDARAVGNAMWSITRNMVT